MKPGAKHIFIGIDGTSNAAFYDKFRTNVHRINLALDHRDRAGNPQFFIYSTGVGSSYKEMYSWLGRAFGLGIDEIILEAYINLVSNYVPGDQIYIFGFSRGSIAARALSGLISCSGLLRPECSVKIEDAWKFFIREKEEGRKLTYDYETLKNELVHPGVSVRFLGIWDTVYGRTDQPAEQDPFTRLRFSTRNLDPSIEAGVQILSIDDTRKYFEPLLWDDVSHLKQRMEQIWLPGVHADIGGGYEESFLSNLSLLTMLDKLVQYCPDVKLDKKYIREHVLRGFQKNVVINDEWSDPIIGDQERQRSINVGLRGRRQNVHPAASYLVRTVIDVRRQKRAYLPTNIITSAGISLPLTRFSGRSFHRKLLEDFAARLAVTQDVAAPISRDEKLRRVRRRSIKRIVRKVVG